MIASIRAGLAFPDSAGCSGWWFQPTLRIYAGEINQDDLRGHALFRPSRMKPR
jgi:hypothetical protein